MMLMAGCSNGSTNTAADWPVEKEVVYELGTKVVLSPEAFLKADADAESVKVVEIESALKTDPAYEFTGFTNEVKTAGKKYLMPGQYTVTLKKDGQKEDITLTVRDTTAPSFISAPRQMIVQQGDTQFDLASKFKADDYDEVTITSKGDYDITVPGDYPVMIIATDASGNANELPITLKVIGQNQAIDSSMPVEDLLILETGGTTSAQNSSSAQKEETVPAPETAPVKKAEEEKEEEKKEEPKACTIKGNAPGDNAFYSLESMIAAGSSWNAKSPNNYFMYAKGLDDCGNTVYLISYGTAPDSQIPEKEADSAAHQNTGS